MSDGLAGGKEPSCSHIEAGVPQGESSTMRANMATKSLPSPSQVPCVSHQVSSGRGRARQVWLHHRPSMSKTRVGLEVTNHRLWYTCKSPFRTLYTDEFTPYLVQELNIFRHIL